jgi:transposase InsO family protein
VLRRPVESAQYAAGPYQQLLTTHGITVSMSRTGNCWDNACVESFLGTLKRELVYHQQYTTRREATQDIFEDKSRCSLLGSAVTHPPAIDLQRSLRPRRLSRNLVSTEFGGGSTGARHQNWLLE